MDIVVGRSKEARKVNSIFGEGVNPLMRKIREALAILGLPSDELLKHGNQRVVYGVALARNFNQVLCGLSHHPQFFIPRNKEKLRTDLLAEFWRQRWLLHRIERPEILEEVARHTLIYPIQHGAQVRLPESLEETMSLFVTAGPLRS
jgi:hypothetical protein